MAVNPTYPGVYVQERPSGVRAIAAAATSIGMFVGRAGKGPINVPTRLTTYDDFVRVFSDNGAISDMARYVRLFFLNGGSDCYIMRVANGFTTAEVTLQTANSAPSLRLIARSAGASGEEIRATVTYSGEQPEIRFSLEVYRWAPNAAGISVKSEAEIYRNLTMDPADPLYAPDIITQESRLVTAELAAGAPAAGNGLSLVGRSIRATFSNPADVPGSNKAELIAALRTLFGADGGVAGNRFDIAVGRRSFVNADLSGIDFDALTNDAGLVTVADVEGAVATQVQAAVAAAYQSAGEPGVAVTVSFVAGPTPTPAGQGNASRLMQISATGQDVRVRASSQGTDLAAAMMMGAALGGLEIGAHAAVRPAPNGLSIRLDTVARYVAFADRRKDHTVEVQLPQVDGTAAAIAVPVDGVASHRQYADTYAASVTGNSDGVRQKLIQIRDAVNAERDANPQTFRWTATLAGTRLAFARATDGRENLAETFIGTLATLPAANDLVAAGLVTANARTYSVGAGGIAGFQTPTAAPAVDGGVPLSADYDAAYVIIDRDVRLFNLLVLPPDREVQQDMIPLYSAASAFAEDRRAFLICDPPPAVMSQTNPVQAMSTEVNAVRQSIVRDHAALYFPRLRIDEDGRELSLGPAGAMAGLMARTDTNRGVWKAAAGLDANLLGVAGVERQLSDGENGILNPRAVNVIRSFPAGVISWGARTLDGDDDFSSEWKYVAVRRTALFIQESLYRGLQWAVFEPNGHVLWSQIRTNVGAFMHGLFRRGAFKGEKPDDAYFVRCDQNTTTQTDIDLGIVNVIVGFAPLKPAEFVIITLQQMAGQTEV